MSNEENKHEIIIKNQNLILDEGVLEKYLVDTEEEAVLSVDKLIAKRKYKWKAMQLPKPS